MRTLLWLVWAGPCWVCYLPVRLWCWFEDGDEEDEDDGEYDYDDSDEEEEDEDDDEDDEDDEDKKQSSVSILDYQEISKEELERQRRLDREFDKL